ncbi:hypothetical protein ACVI1L_003702 [Bradyrhizobium sp. USDA 4516]
MRNSLNAVGKGVEHLGNEIGVLWAHLKQDAIDKAKSFLDWLAALAEKSVPLAGAVVFGMMTLATAVAVYVPKMIAAMFRRQRPARKTRIRHA